MISQERILEIAKECDEIMKHSKFMNGENRPKQFSSIEEVRAYYHSIPLEEFDKQFRSAYGSDEKRQLNESKAQKTHPLL